MFIRPANQTRFHWWNVIIWLVRSFEKPRCMRPEGLFFAFFLGEPLIQGRIWKSFKICPGVSRRGMVTLGIDWHINLINAFALLKSKIELILFCCRQVFHNFSWRLWWYRKNVTLTTKNYWWEKLIDYIFILPHQSTALHKVTIAKRNFQPNSIFDNWGNRARRLLTVEEDEALTFQAVDLVITVADMFIELYC